MRLFLDNDDELLSPQGGMSVLPCSLPPVVGLDHVERLRKFNVDIIAVVSSLSVEEVGEKPEIDAGTCLDNSAPEGQTGSSVIERRGDVAYLNFRI